MLEAIRLAKKSAAAGEIPVGAVVVRGDKIIGRGYNRRITDADPCAHAEVVALRRAAKREGVWNLSGCDLYVTLEPCIMCYGAAVNARIDNLYYGAADAKFGIADQIPTSGLKFNHTVNIQGGFFARECSAILSEFFKALRQDPRA